ncbi:hypothetical protein KIPB_012885, partial [Kipferlia bialata]
VDEETVSALLKKSSQAQAETKVIFKRNTIEMSDSDSDEESDF